MINKEFQIVSKFFVRNISTGSDLASASPSDGSRAAIRYDFNLFDVSYADVKSSEKFGIQIKIRGISVTIGDARQVYSAKINALNEQRKALYEQKKALEEGKLEMTDEEISALGKAIDRVEANRDNASKIMEAINTQRMFLQNAESSKRSGEYAAKQAEDYSKCLEVARRIARGDKVPCKDEQKLMEFSSVMYMTAKNMAALAQNERIKKHKSLWKDEDDNGQPQRSVDDVVDSMECGVSMPDISAGIDIGIE